MSEDRSDNGLTAGAIGMLGYASADIAHHVFGHGGACLARGGSILSLSSVFVDCTLRGTAIDLAGPFMNLALGIVALIVLKLAPRASAATRLFWILVAAFNLFWFAMQLVFSVVTRTDDWAWAMLDFHVGAPGRYAAIVLGIALYLVTVRLVAAPLAAYAKPRARVTRLVLIALGSALLLAAATAVFDHRTPHALLRNAIPQAILLPIGLLFVPERAAGLASESPAAAPLAFSLSWLIGAALVAVVSIGLLGPGFAIG
ncbi:MAG TPA: hypothetical protein VF848_09835 [Steroidobacteraceae bacterium]